MVLVPPLDETQGTAGVMTTATARAHHRSRTPTVTVTLASEPASTPQRGCSSLPGAKSSGAFSWGVARRRAWGRVAKNLSVIHRAPPWAPPKEPGTDLEFSSSVLPRGAEFYPA